jgi:hypothetical protein
VVASRDNPRAAFFGRAGLRRNLRWDALDSTYFAGYAMWNYLTHQTFYVDSSGLIRRHDYTAEVVGGWARAAHYLSEHRQVDGLTFPTRRRVRPIGARNRALPGPTLVWIELDALRIQKG